jgi:hypothetical protein
MGAMNETQLKAACVLYLKASLSRDASKRAAISLAKSKPVEYRGYCRVSATKNQVKFNLYGKTIICSSKHEMYRSDHFTALVVNGLQRKISAAFSDVTDVVRREFKYNAVTRRRLAAKRSCRGLRGEIKKPDPGPR